MSRTKFRRITFVFLCILFIAKNISFHQMVQFDSEVDGNFKRMRLSRDGQTFAISNSDNGTIEIWDIHSGKKLCDVYGSGRCLAFSPIDHLVATHGLDGRINIWDRNNGKIQVSLEEHDGEIFTIAFSPDGKYVVSGGEFGIKLWELRNFNEFASFPSDATVLQLTLSADGKSLAYVVEDDQIKIYVRNLITLHSANSFCGFWAIILKVEQRERQHSEASGEQQQASYG